VAALGTCAKLCKSDVLGSKTAHSTLSQEYLRNTRGFDIPVSESGLGRSR
jgi:hypothetical protein